MEQKRPGFIATEEKTKLPLLIIDKEGTLGSALAKTLTEQFLVVLVSNETTDLHKNIITIPYRKKIPRIPDHTYSHLFVFYNGEKEVLAMFPALVKKAEQTQARLLFVTSLLHSEPKLLEYLTHQVCQVVLYGEMAHNQQKTDNLVDLFLSQAQTYGKIVIPNDGIGKLYPVLFADVLRALISIGFSTENKNKLFYLFPKHPVSELSIARMLQKHTPLLKIDFKKYYGKRPDYYIPQAGEYFFANYPLEEKLKGLINERVSSRIVREEKPLRVPNPKRNRRWRFFWIFVLYLCVLPLLITVLAGVSGMASLGLSVKEVEKGKIAEAKHFAVFARTALDVAEATGGYLFLIDLVAKEQKQTVMAQLATGGQLAQTEVDLLDAVVLGQSLASNKSLDARSDFFRALSLMKNAFMALQKLKAENSLPSMIATKFADMESIIMPLENTIDVLPALLGFEGKRQYLVLFQNNMELRPGGGFIGSYGLLELEKGRLSNFKIYDVYDADGKLTQHLEPPVALRRYLGASHWFLRDSNFDVDFPHDAARAATFLQLETGDKVDGVLAVDTTFLKNLLEVVGSVQVADYKETVTPDNFYLLTQTHVEKNFFPGSTQKKDFLRALLESMTSQLSEKKNLSYSALVKKIGESIRGKHLLFVVSDQATQKLFTVNNLSSSLFDGREPGENGLLDFFGVVDANLGMNKTNYYLKRSLEQHVDIDDKGSLQTTATVTYTNTSKKDSPFGGDYKNYVRFVLPAQAVLKSVTIDDKEAKTTPAVIDPAIFTAKRFLPPKELEVEKTQEQGKALIGFLVMVGMGETKKVSITYTLPHAVDTTKPAFSYDLQVFKQPGTDADPYSLFMSYPSTFKLVTASSGLSDVGGKLLYSGVLSEDKHIRAEFSRK